MGGLAGWQIGKAQGAKGWGMFGYIAGGAAIGAFTSGWASGSLGSMAATTPGLTTSAFSTIGAYAFTGAVAGATSGVGFAAMSGGNMARGAMWGGIIGGASGVLGGILKHQRLMSEIWKNVRQQPKFACVGCPPETFYGGTLNEVTITGARPVNPWAGAMAATGVLFADDVSGVGVADNLLIPVVLATAAAYDLTQRTYVTYTLSGPGGKTYVGRASGFGEPHSIMMNRYRGHHMKSLGCSNPTLDRFVEVVGRVAIRGREQQMIDFMGGQVVLVLKMIRGVSRYNIAGRLYHNMSDFRFGQLHSYTGF